MVFDFDFFLEVCTVEGTPLFWLYSDDEVFECDWGSTLEQLSKANDQAERASEQLWKSTSEHLKKPTSERMRRPMSGRTRRTSSGWPCTLLKLLQRKKKMRNLVWAVSIVGASYIVGLVAQEGKRNVWWKLTFQLKREIRSLKNALGQWYPSNAFFAIKGDIVRFWKSLPLSYTQHLVLSQHSTAEKGKQMRTLFSLRVSLLFFRECFDRTEWGSFPFPCPQCCTMCNAHYFKLSNEHFQQAYRSSNFHEVTLSHFSSHRLMSRPLKSQAAHDGLRDYYQKILVPFDLYSLRQWVWSTSSTLHRETKRNSNEKKKE